MTEPKFFWPGTATSDVAATAAPPAAKPAKAKKELPVGHVRLTDVLTSVAMTAALKALPEDIDGLVLHGIGPSRAGPVVPLVRALKPKFVDVAKNEKGEIRTGQFSKIRDAALRLIEKQNEGKSAEPLALESAKLLTPFNLNVKMGETPDMAKAKEVICVLAPLLPATPPAPGGKA